MLIASVHTVIFIYDQPFALLFVRLKVRTCIVYWLTSQSLLPIAGGSRPHFNKADKKIEGWGGCALSVFPAWQDFPPLWCLVF